MTERENLFRPIHKGIRSMIYQMGLRLGTTDFRDAEASNRVVSELQRDLALSTSNCFLCLMKGHSRHEERDFFAPVRRYDADVVEEMLKEHRAILIRLQAVSKTGDELRAETRSERRLEIGNRLHLDLSDFFVSYLSHLNNEEALMVPVMWERFTDEQLRFFRAEFYNRIPLPRFEEWMRWTLPALNPHELVVLLSGMKEDPSPNRFADAMRIARNQLPPERWTELISELGI